MFEKNLSTARRAQRELALAVGNYYLNIEGFTAQKRTAGQARGVPGEPIWGEPCGHSQQ